MFGRSFAQRTVVRCCVLLLVSTLGMILPIPAIATDSPTDPVTLSSESFASIYMDAPFVQASYASAGTGATNVQTENFDNLLPPSTDKCPENIAVGTVSPTSACLLYANDPNFGGATTSSSDPVDSGAHSTYAAVHSDAPLTITFPSAKKYVGFWWSAGSDGNNVSFLDESGRVVVAELNANDIYNAVSANPITALDSKRYLSSDYLGHPGVRNTDESGNPIRYDPTEPFVYIHAFSPIGFHAIQLSAPGSGFEFDNLTTADTAPSVDPRLVPVRDIYASQVLPTPSPNPGYTFGGWYSDSCFENYIGIPDDTYYPDSASSTLYPQWFGPYTYTFTYSAGSHGTLTGFSSQTVSAGASGTAVTAVADGGYYFVNWDDGSTANPRTDINASGDITVSANFSPFSYVGLAPSSGPIGSTINLKGTQLGRIDGGPGWQTVYYKAFTNGAWGGWTILTAVAQNHSGDQSIDVVIPANLGAGTTKLKFHIDACLKWDTGDGCYPLDNDDAVFMITYTFTYSAGSHGTITGVSPQTVNAGSSGTAVTAVADSGYHFVNWSDSSTANPRTDINASGDISVSAIFSANGGGGGGGGGGGEYSPPSPPETIIIIPATPSQPVIVQQPKKSGVKPARDVKVSKVESTTLIQIAPKPLITLGSSDIAIQGLNKGQYIRVTVTGVNGASQVITPSDNSELNTIINNNPKSKLKIEITPTLSSALKTGARIGINGAKKNQRVRVTVQ